MGKYLVKFDKDRCKSCYLCVSVCPKKILRIDPDQMNLKGFHPADIFDQGACIGSPPPFREARFFLWRTRLLSHHLRHLNHQLLSLDRQLVVAVFENS